MNDNPDTIRSVMIPVSDGFLLLPSAMVAEVLRLQDAELPDEDMPKHLLNWRHQRVPLLSLETIADLPPPEQADSRIVILYGISEELPFLALNSASIPRIQPISSDMLKNPQIIDDAPGLLAKVQFEQHTVYLPDMEYLQDVVLES